MLQAKRVKAFNPWINRVIARGFTTEITVPELARKMEAYRSDAMSAEVDVDYGLEKLTCSQVLEGADTQLITSMGVCLNEAPHFRFLVSVEGEDCATDSHEYILRGRINKMTQDPFKSGDKSQVKVEITLHRYTFSVNGIEHIHIEPMETIERYMGVDRLAAWRKALGMD